MEPLHSASSALGFLGHGAAICVAAPVEGQLLQKSQRYSATSENVHAHRSCRSAAGEERLWRRHNAQQTQVPQRTESEYDPADLSTAKDMGTRP